MNTVWVLFVTEYEGLCNYKVYRCRPSFEELLRVFKEWDWIDEDDEAKHGTYKGYLVKYDKVAAIKRLSTDGSTDYGGDYGAYLTLIEEIPR